MNADTSEESRLRQDLEQFASQVSHDLSGPLHAVVGFLELLTERAGPSLGTKEREYVEYASEAAAHATTRLAELVAELRQRAREVPTA
jgi:signal transduction histidine kinase